MARNGIVGRGLRTPLNPLWTAGHALRGAADTGGAVMPAVGFMGDMLADAPGNLTGALLSAPTGAIGQGLLGGGGALLGGVTGGPLGAMAGGALGSAGAAAMNAPAIRPTSSGSPP